MCLAIPARVVSIDEDDMATVAVDGIRKRISTALVDDVSVGDYLLIHVGYALHRLSEEEAQQTLALMASAGILETEIDELAIGAQSAADNAARGESSS